jgi:hypothetical protein
MTNDEKHLMTRLAFMLDASIEALDAEAKREAKREAGKSLRQITAQERAKAAVELVEEAFDALGMASERGR